MPIVVDSIQVAQYVSEAALALFPDNAPEQDHWVQAHLPEILRGKASLVAAGIQQSATLRGMAAAERKPGSLCQIISSATRHIFSTTRRWLRVSRSLPGR